MSVEQLKQSILACKAKTLVFIITSIYDLNSLIEGELFKYEFKVAPSVYYGCPHWEVSVNLK